MSTAEPTPNEPSQPSPGGGPGEHGTSSQGTGRYVIRYRHPGTVQIDGVEHPIGWVFAVDLVDYFGAVYGDDDPRWSYTEYADEATLYRSRDHAEEVVEYLADRWSAVTVVDMDAVPVVDFETARSLDDAERAAVLVLSPGTRMVPADQAPNAGPGCWPKVRADQYRQPAAALDDAQRALEKVNEGLDRAGQPVAGVDIAAAPPLEPTPATGPGITP